jgi:hypothetical protein
MSIESIKNATLAKTDQLPEASQDNQLRIDREKLRNKVLEILQRPSEVDTVKLVNRSTKYVLSNPFDEFDPEEFKRKVNLLDQKEIKSWRNS